MELWVIQVNRLTDGDEIVSITLRPVIFLVLIPAPCLNSTISRAMLRQIQPTATVIEPTMFFLKN
jgi:hypothetical protein